MRCQRDSLTHLRQISADTPRISSGKPFADNAFATVRAVSVQDFYSRVHGNEEAQANCVVQRDAQPRQDY